MIQNSNAEALKQVEKFLVSSYDQYMKERSFCERHPNDQRSIDATANLHDRQVAEIFNRTPASDEELERLLNTDISSSNECSEELGSLNKLNSCLPSSTLTIARLDRLEGLMDQLEKHFSAKLTG